METSECLVCIICVLVPWAFEEEGSVWLETGHSYPGLGVHLRACLSYVALLSYASALGGLSGIELSTFMELPVHMGLGSRIAGLEKVRAHTPAVRMTLF